MNNTIYFDTLYNKPLPIDFQGHEDFFLITKKIGPKGKNDELWNLLIKTLEFVFHMSCLGVFQFARDILQSTVFLNHPVALDMRP